jgi:hypothetical protein
MALYNHRSGTVRIGRYAVAATPLATEDGFTPDLLTSGPAIVSLTRYHSADTNRDGRLSLTELTRVIELFNTRAGTTRTGAYHAAATPYRHRRRLRPRAVKFCGAVRSTTGH